MVVDRIGPMKVFSKKCVLTIRETLDRNKVVLADLYWKAQNKIKF